MRKLVLCKNENMKFSKEWLSKFKFFHFHILKKVNTLKKKKKKHFCDKIEFDKTNKTKNDHFGEIFENHKNFKSTPWLITADSYCKSHRVIILFWLGLKNVWFLSDNNLMFYISRERAL